MRVGQPFLVGPDGTVDVRINRWFVSDEIRDLSRSTWEKYAYNLGVWLSFLSAYGCLWDEADAGVQGAFKFWRVLDERNERLVSLGTYEHDLIAIRLFYVWADGEYGVGNPIRMRRSCQRGRRRGGTFTERPETAPKAVRDRDVKWFAPAGYARYRDVGLLGLTVDGDEDPSFRGRNSQRDGAFADGLYGTGLRLREWGSVLLMELPPDDRNREYYTCDLGAATAKGEYGRQYWMSRPALQEALNYVEGERATAVRRAQRVGRYERLSRSRIIVHPLAGKRLRLRGLDGQISDVSLDVLTPDARRRLLRETPDGLEPAALWLNEDGTARAPRGWHHTFDTANQRLARLSFVGFAGAAHMMRHSFALR
jgi:site-specific recombinase XerD